MHLGKGAKRRTAGQRPGPAGKFLADSRRAAVRKVRARGFFRSLPGLGRTGCHSGVDFLPRMRISQPSLVMEDTMYAIIETGGKQFRVEEGAKIFVEKLEAEAGSEIVIDKVLMLGGGAFSVGAPYVEGAKVTAEVVEHGRGEKLIVFKKWRRNDSRKKQGHRQDFTALKIKAIQA
jgi:large subunit ribosomal protein L21